MPVSTDRVVEGITLKIYLYVVKKNRPVGPRDVTKALSLSSPSVAYRHLEKLEELGFLKKNNYGEYVPIAKAHVKGYVWIGRFIVPKLFVYSIVFLGILLLELLVLAVHYSVEDFSFMVFFFLLISVTGSAMLLFAVEGFLQRKRIRQQSSNENFASVS